jgi:hypothetical protein
LERILPWFYLIVQDEFVMYEGLLKDFEEVINEIISREGMSHLKRAEKAIPVCNKTLSLMQDIVEKEDFESPEMEITFFKSIKVIPMSFLIYFSEIRSCEVQKPKAGVDFQVRFFEKEIKKINKFFSRNSDFVHYMEQGHSYLDHQFFSRSHFNNFPLTPVINYYQYPEFTTSHDMLWAKIQAMYKYIHYIRSSIQILKPGKKQLFNEKRHKLLLWTGSKTSMVELIYALYSTGVLNHGTVELSAVTSSFEDFFNVKLENIYKTYSEIKSRKGSKTKFLDDLRLNLELKMDKDDAL